MQHRILIVDDSESILLGMRKFLTNQGFQVDGARDAEDAKVLLTNERYSVAIVDLSLTVEGTEGGFCVIRYIREKWPETRIIVLTAYGTPEVKKEALRLGVDSFLHKPKPLAEIAQIVFGLLDE